MTQAGYDRLHVELQRLKDERPLISRAIGAALEHGDLRENAEYHAAKDRQGMVEARIRQIESALGAADIIDTTTLGGDRVQFGARVSVVEGTTGQRNEYTVVGEHESDAANGLISFKSPIARALIGKTVGDVVEVQTPRGERELEIVAIRFG
ncbi:MAG: transcription elongation factor GreA [Alphaproteobacteria bacterium]